jgi:hypothetical protein
LEKVNALALPSSAVLLKVYLENKKKRFLRPEAFKIKI